MVRRVAFVTGGASGIGLALSGALVHRGVHVVLTDIDGEAAATAARALQDEGPGTAEAAQLDVADAAAVAAVIEGAYEQHGRLDYVFNNAGIGVAGEPEELSLAHWERIIDVNLRGVLHGCHVTYPLMLQQGFGHIVNTASLAGLVPSGAIATPYSMTKHAVVGLSLGLRAAGADHGVQVHVVCPGVIDTPMFDKREIPGLPTPPSTAGMDAREAIRDTGLKNFYPPARLAEDILRGIKRDRAIIVSPAHARMAWRITRLSPRWAFNISVKSTRKMRQRARLPR